MTTSRNNISQRYSKVKQGITQTAIIYCRVSTDDQEREGTSLDSQLKACKGWAEREGYSVPEQFVVMETCSGLSLDRPKLNELREWVRGKGVSAVIAYTLDRLSRDPVHFIILQEELEKAGVELILVTEDIDSSDMGKLIVHIKGYAAKLEAEKIKERTIRGKKYKAAMGDIPSGFGRCVFWGLRYDSKQKRFEHIPGQIDIVKEILTRYVADESSSSITITLQKRGILSATGGRIHRSAVNRVLSHANVYAGHLTWAGYPLSGKVGPIITAEEANIVAERLKKNKELGYGFGRCKLLTGRIFCGLCGRRYSLQARKGCRCGGGDARNPVICPAPKIGFKELTDCVYAAVFAATMDDEALIRRTGEVWKHWEVGMAGIASKLHEKDRQLATFDRRRGLLSFQHESGGLTDKEYLSKLEAIKKGKIEVLEQLERLSRFTMAEEPPRPEEVRKTLANASSVWDSLLWKVVKAMPLVKIDLVKGEERQKQLDELYEWLGLKAMVYPDDNVGFKLDIFVNIPIQRAEACEKVMVSPSSVCCKHHLPLLVTVTPEPEPAINILVGAGVYPDPSFNSLPKKEAAYAR